MNNAPHSNPEEISPNEPDQKVIIDSLISQVQSSTRKAAPEHLSHLQFSPLTQDLIPKASQFFEAQMKEMQPLGYNKEAIEWHCNNHTVPELSEKIQDSVRYFEIVRDDRTGNIVAYFESRQTKLEQEAQFGQFVQWIFVHPEYGTSGIARKLFDHFHDFCRAYGYEYASSVANVKNLVSQEMHQKFGYQRLPEYEKEPDTLYYRKNFDRGLKPE